MVMLNQGQVIASGVPWSILQPALLHDVFGVDASLIREPQAGKPLIVAHQELLVRNRLVSWFTLFRVQ